MTCRTALCATALAALLLGPPGPALAAPATTRWYTPAQVARGEQVYRANCQGCHGARAEGAAPQAVPVADAPSLPPPLNGSGHSAHHGLDELLLTIQRGRGGMPRFEGRLSPDEQRAVIAFIQSLWPEAAYREWHSLRQAVGDTHDHHG